LAQLADEEFQAINDGFVRCGCERFSFSGISLRPLDASFNPSAAHYSSIGPRNYHLEPKREGEIAETQGRIAVLCLKYRETANPINQEAIWRRAEISRLDQYRSFVKLCESISSRLPERFANV
jgi:hypothetical protein